MCGDLASASEKKVGTIIRQCIKHVRYDLTLVRWDIVKADYRTYQATNVSLFRLSDTTSDFRYDMFGEWWITPLPTNDEQYLLNALAIKAERFQ
jgi:hypothetical protein